MTPRQPRLRTSPFLVATCALALLAGCDAPLDYDMRGLSGGFTTADAARAATAQRPVADERGILSYPNYQVVIARRGETVTDIAKRIGADPAELSGFNAIAPDAPLREGEVIALHGRVVRKVPVNTPVPDAAPVATTPLKPNTVDVTTLAGQAIEKAPETETQPIAETPGPEPIRHKVKRGETAFTIARRYEVAVRDLAKWNGLGPDYAIREGQYVLIPPSSQSSAATTPPAATTNPGQGSPTPQPPSSGKPLPQDAKPAPQKKTDKPIADLGKRTKASATGRFAAPIIGTVIRDYAKGRNEGIDIKAAPGTSVKAAEAGTVAAITQNSEGVPIVVVRHKGNLLTVYANVTDVAVKKGDQVRRGQSIAKLRAGKDSFVHFEVRKGFDSVDPNEYLG